jgi:sec-independent protein translocase protein TatA
MGMPGGTEWLIILVVVVLLFGGKKIPELAKGLGKGIKDFKKAMNDEDEPSKESKPTDVKPIEDKKAETTQNKSETTKA